MAKVLTEDEVRDKDKIYNITKSINDCLHVEFGIKNLYHRMIFTACALVAERYGANLRKTKDMGFSVFQTAVHKVLQNLILIFGHTFVWLFLF